MSSWQDRVNAAVYLTSPTGQSFMALWVGNDRDKEKALGVFKYPKARGAVVQDMGMGPVREPITLYFEGADHDIDAQAFWNACDETGVWSILHPTKGRITRQLVRVSEAIQPVTSGNVTAFECEWLEPDLDNPAVSVTQLEDDVQEQIENAQSAAAGQFTATVDTRNAGGLLRLAGAAKKAIATVTNIKGTISGISAAVTAAASTIAGVISASVMLTNSLASAVMGLILLPGESLRSAKTQFEFLGRVLDTTFTDFGADFKDVYGSRGSVNAAAVVELVATTSVIGMAGAVVNAQFSTREEALQYLEAIQAAFLKMVNGLDGVQAAYAGRTVDKQYFSQTASYAEMLELMRRVRELLLRRSFDLATAKRITLQRDRAPVEIAITEGMDLDVFIASNQLKGNDVLLLPAGRQVVIYG